jgi:hypothetical protein
MAKFSSGPTVGAVSGSIGGTTYSHNRYGAYIRRRAIPVNPGTEWQMRQKGYLTLLSQAWSALGADVQTSWKTWAESNPVTDSLGNKQSLTGHVAFIGLNARLLRAGNLVVSSPPIAAAPPALTSLTLTTDIGAGSFQVAYTATPLGAGNKLWVLAAVVDSAGVVYVKNLTKLVHISAAAQASPVDLTVPVESRFGTLIVGQKVIVYVSVFSGVTGLLSGSLRDAGVVVST